MPKQIGTADAERIAMTTDEKLERFRQIIHWLESIRNVMHIPFAYLIGMSAIMLGSVVLVGALILLFSRRS